MKTLTVDDRQRIRLPKAKAGQVFAYEPDSDGSIKLVPVITKPGPKRVVPKGYKLDPDAIAKAVAEERESRYAGL